MTKRRFSYTYRSGRLHRLGRLTSLLDFPATPYPSTPVRLRFRTEPYQ
jgi:hypothetical protein